MYATGTPTSLSDFLNALNTFAVSAGWTSNFNGHAGFSGASHDYYLALNKDTCFLNYYVPDTTAVAGTLTLQLFGSTAYAGSTAPSAQAGASTNPTLMFPPPAGPYNAYHFFSTATSGVDYLHTLLEYSAGNFLQLHGGRLNAVGGAAPVIYCAGTSWSSLAGGNSASDGGPGIGNYTPFSAESPGGSSGGWREFQIRATVDSVARWFWPANVSPARAIGAVRNSSKNVHAFARSPNTFNQLVPLIPLSLFLERAVGQIYSYVGDVIDMRLMNLANNQAKDEITIGSDTWKVFPVISKQPFGSATAATNNYGFAFRKNA
jgi:hypothetical protein